ncbi:hypothetical protein B7463_g4257, partial [Scytalidium lignicola]
MSSHSEELSRALSNLNLNTLPDDIEKRTATYTREELLSLRPAAQTDIDPGLASPDVPTVPPPTPVRPASPTHDKHENPIRQSTPSRSLSPVHTAKDATDDREENTNVKPSESADVGDEDEAAPVAEKKKKKKKKSSGKNRLPPATGFEEFYADSPMTPGDFYEEREYYTSDIPFHTRIQTCIQRYRGKRKLDAFRANVFTKYLTLGGLDSSNAKAFGGGLDKDMVENSTTNEIIDVQATDHIREGAHNIKFYDPTDSEHWVVDFEGVVKGFLSHTAPSFIDMTNETSIKAVCAVIRNFLNYVLAHNVCPEYNDDVYAARRVCDLAEEELPAMVEFSSLIPGDFNKAISMIYGGRYASLFSSDNPDLDDDELNKSAKANVGISVREATRIFKTGVVLSAPHGVFERAMKEDVEIIKTEMRYFEVVEAQRADLKTIETFRGVKDIEGNTGNIKPLGTLKVRAWEGPGLEPEDVTDDEAEAKLDMTTIESFLLEDQILALCFPGMKMQVVVGKLNIGLKFIDTFMDTYPTFLVVLPNEKMFNWKDPVPNTRPPPTDEDPDVEERVLSNSMMDD